MSSFSRGRGRVAVVDEDDAELGALLDVLSKSGHAVVGMRSVELAAAALPLLEVDLVISSAAGAAARRAGGPAWMYLLDAGDACPDPASGSVERPLSRAAFLAAVDFAIRASRAQRTSIVPVPTRAWRDALSSI